VPAEPTRDPERLDLAGWSRFLSRLPGHRGGGCVSLKTARRDDVTGADLSTLLVGPPTDPAAPACFDLERLNALSRDGSEPSADARFSALYRTCLVPGTGPGDGPGWIPSAALIALHALVPDRHVNQVRTLAVTAIVRGPHAGHLLRECFGDDVALLPDGPGLVGSIRAAMVDGPRAIVLRTGDLVCWSDSRSGCERATEALAARAAGFVASRTGPRTTAATGATTTAGGVAGTAGGVAGTAGGVAGRDRARTGAALGPVLRGTVAQPRPLVGHFTDDDRVMAFMASASFGRLADQELHLPGRPDPVLPFVVPDGAAAQGSAQLRSRFADRTHGSDPAAAVFLAPGEGMWCFAADAADARAVASAYLELVEVLRLAERLSGGLPGKRPRDAFAAAAPRPRTAPPPAGGDCLRGRVAMVTGAASGIGRAIAVRLSAAGAAVVVADIDTRGLANLVAELGGADAATAVGVDLCDESQVEAAVRTACLSYGGLDLVVNNAGLSVSAPLLDTTVADWDRQHRVMARGSFLVSRAAAAVMLAQAMPGDIVYIASKNAVAAGVDNVAYGAAKADQEHQVRLLAVELGRHGIRVNGVNPDGVTRDSGIFRGDWGDQRARTYGIDRADLGAFYAGRTLLGEEVLPEHVAEAVLVLVGGRLPRTTGTILPVDGGVAAAFLR
jgi:NAD(P)-dependent dehydrogenase (short-subunit alcohol dehydrogenase family)/rhamnose utilization protein RhaD (predicted bifunctional aldolase and dehydrogenase)